MAEQLQTPALEARATAQQGTGDLRIEDVLSDSQPIPKLLFAILQVLVKIHNRLPEPAAPHLPVFAPQRITLSTGTFQSFERSAPHSSWVIAMESSPSGAQVNVHWGEYRGMAPFVILSAGDILRTPALGQWLVLENPSAGNSTFTLAEIA